MLGLPPDKGYTHFAELWVLPADLFRPAYDPEITDTECGLSYPGNIDPEYVGWFEDNIIYSYFPAPIPMDAPWLYLRLGRLRRDRHVEFVLRKGFQRDCQDYMQK